MKRIPTSLSERLRLSKPAGKRAVVAVLWSWIAFCFRGLVSTKMRSRRRFLFFGHSRVIVQHQLRFFRVVKKYYPDARFRIVLFGMDHALTQVMEGLCGEAGLKKIKEVWVPFVNWDLCIVADHCYQDEFIANNTPKLFIYHGMGSIKKVNGENYKYGDSFVLNRYGRLKYDAMFEAGEFQKAYASKVAPKLKNVLSAAGDLEVDSFLEMCSRKEDIRDELGYDRNQKILLVQSTWSGNSIEQRLGTELFSLCEKLADSLDLRIIFSSHPAHWGGKKDLEDRSEYYLSHESERVRILRPDEDRHPLMAIADVCLSDITTLSTIYAFSKRPLVFSIGESSELDSGSELAQLIEACPSGESSDELEALISDAFEKRNDPNYTHLLDSFCRYPGMAPDPMMKKVASLME